MSTRRFELVQGSSRKFWELTVEGSTVSVRYGRLGAKGRVTVKELPSPADAEAHASRQIRSKLAKGYAEVGASAAAPAASTPTRSRSDAPGDVFARLEAALARRAPQVLARLRTGASDKQIAAMKKAVKVELPELFLDFYRWRNGAPEEVRWLDGLAWLDTKGVASLKTMMDGIIDDGHYASWSLDEWWSKGWVSFADDGSGYRALVVDTHGSFGGKAGQVLSAAAKDHDRVALAGDFEHWLELLVETYERGRFEVDDGSVYFQTLPGGLHRGYPRRYQPTEAGAPSETGDLQAPTRAAELPTGVDPEAQWLVQPDGARVEHWLVARRGKAVETWSGTDLAKLRHTTKRTKNDDAAKHEHDAQLRKRIKTGFTVLRPAERARRGDCVTVMQVGTELVGLAGDGRTLAFGTMGPEARGAALWLADAVTGRRSQVHTVDAGAHQTFVHMVDFDERDRPVWMLGGATCLVDVERGTSKVLFDIDQPGKQELFNPHVSRSAFDAAGQRLLAFHKTGVRVREGGKIVFRLPVRRGKREVRYAGISPSGKRVALVVRSRHVIYGHEDAKDDTTNEIQIHDVDGGELVHRVPIPAHVGHIRRVGISADDAQVLIGDYRALHGIDLKTGKAWKRADTREWAYSPDGRWLAVAQRGARVELLDAMSRRKRTTFETGGPWANPWGEIHDTDRLAFSRDGSRLLQVAGGRVYLWIV